MKLKCASILMRYCSCLFFCKAVREWYRERGRGLGSGLFRWKTLVSNAWIRELCSDKEGDERIDKSVLRWFGLIEKKWGMIGLLKEDM